MELTRLATRVLWHIVERSKNGECVTRTVLRWHSGSISTENINLTLAHLIAAGLIVEDRGSRRPRRGAIPTFYVPTEKAKALDLKRPRHGNFRTDSGNTSITARLSVELYNRLAAAADANDVPLNTEIIRRLQASFTEADLHAEQEALEIIEALALMYLVLEKDYALELPELVSRARRYLRRVQGLDVGSGDVNTDFGGDGSPQA